MTTQTIQPELCKALVAFQKECPSVRCDATNPHFKSTYVSLTGLREATRDLLAKHGLAVTQLLGSTSDGSPSVTTMLIHASGQSLEMSLSIKPDRPGAHAIGSAITYARRYSYAAILGLVDSDDDDGNAATRIDSPAERAATAQNLRSFRKELESQSATAGAGDFVLKFGKRKGMKLREIPDDDLASYRDWLIDNQDQSKPVQAPVSEFLAAVDAWLSRSK